MWFVIVSLCVIHIWSIEHKNRWLFYISKAMPVVLMSALAYQSSDSYSDYSFLIALGLLVSAIGDLFLMHPKDKFLPGLVSFFVAHLVYGYAFFSQADEHFTHWVPAILFSLGLIIYLLLLPTLDKMRAPVAVYSVAILLMAWGAIEVWIDVRNPFAGYAAMGALVFIVSDVVLAVDRFRSSSAFSRHVIMVTYYTAQILLTLSALEESYR
ncbi:membrane protein [Vibrio sinaloensis]|uniref:lysoplasmalogenase n=1 Tax=Photobacterium sp. (strain ATCC 43367) TaxID=379097 RepID=UPI00057D1BD6|nr:lysoplasmalogenase [Vibrio sinaloensis]KIE21407.1 membrane protein [Vibrio sinaloensis]